MCQTLHLNIDTPIKVVSPVCGMPYLKLTQTNHRNHSDYPYINICQNTSSPILITRTHALSIFYVLATVAPKSPILILLNHTNIILLSFFTVFNFTIWLPVELIGQLSAHTYWYHREFNITSLHALTNYYNLLINKFSLIPHSQPVMYCQCAVKSLIIMIIKKLARTLATPT